jgi:hypothetical protein
MAQVVALGVADGQVVLVAAAAFAQGLDMLEAGLLGWHVGTAQPAGHLAMQLACYGFVNFQAGVG